MIDSPIITAEETKLIDQLQLENDSLKQRNEVLERMALSAITDAELSRHIKTLPASELSMLCFEYTQGSGTLDELVKYP
jgi:hypothetical protein